MFFFTLAIALIIGILISYLWLRPRPQWDSANWNPETQRFFHAWAPNLKVITFKAIWKYLMAPQGRWPKKVIVEHHPVILNPDDITITNIGHATFLIQMEGVNILTDPVFSKHAGPFGVFGPKRVAEPGLPFELLPPIDVVFVSHNHYDHLDKTSIMNLAEFHNSTFMVPLGVKRTLLKWGVKQPVIELDWGETHEIKGIRITATPAQHWSRRSIFDTNQTLWMGGIFQNKFHSIFFAGDTGWGPHFAEMYKHFGAITIGLLPIGSYKPTDIMKQQHMGPKEALKAHQTLKCSHMIPIHYDVFPLGKENYLEAEKVLIKEAQRLSIPSEQLTVLKVGQRFQLP